MKRKKIKQINQEANNRMRTEFHNNSGKEVHPSAEI